MTGSDDPSEMVRACRVLHTANLGAGLGGFLATRDPLGRGTWITRDGAGFDEVTLDDFVLVGPRGPVTPPTREPDCEVSLALDVMAARPDVQAVVHAHSLYATAFAATGRSLHPISHEGCHLVPPDVTRVSHSGRTGDPFDAQSRVGTLLGSHNSILLAGHGLITVAGSVGEAVALAVYLEKACHLLLLSGDDVHTVADEDVSRKRAGQMRRPEISWQYLERVAP